jgi:hypothetical protein
MALLKAEGMSAAELGAVVRWAGVHGRLWKSALRKAWRTGRYEGLGASSPDVGVLQGLRNLASFGPRGLDAFRLPPADVAALERELAAAIDAYEQAHAAVRAVEAVPHEERPHQAWYLADVARAARARDLAAALWRLPDADLVSRRGRLYAATRDENGGHWFRRVDPADARRLDDVAAADRGPAPGRVAAKWAKLERQGPEAN